MNKKVLHLITGLEVGGAEMMLLRILPLLENSFSNEVCCIKGRGPIGDLLKQKGIPVHYLDLSLSSGVFLPLRFAKVVRRVKPELMVTYLIHADIFGRIMGKILGIPKIISNRRGFYLNWCSLHALDQWTSRLSDAFLVQTEHARKILSQDFHLSIAKIFTIPNGIDLSEYTFPLDNTNKKEALGIPKENINITCVTTFKKGKGLVELILAFESLCKQYPKLSLLLVGDGPLRQELEDRVQKLSSSAHIFFLSKRTDVKEILRISDIFSLPTYSEGMSNALLEAMASRLAIVTTNILVNRELLKEDISALLVPVKDVRALANALEKLIQDPLLRKSLGDRARAKVETSFEIGKVLDRIRETYNHVLER